MDTGPVAAHVLGSSKGPRSRTAANTVPTGRGRTDATSGGSSGTAGATRAEYSIPGTRPGTTYRRAPAGTVGGSSSSDAAPSAGATTTATTGPALATRGYTSSV